MDNQLSMAAKRRLDLLGPKLVRCYQNKNGTASQSNCSKNDCKITGSFKNIINEKINRRLSTEKTTSPIKKSTSPNLDDNGSSSTSSFTDKNFQWFKKRKTENQEHREVPQPIYKDHQLLGDSQFVRLCEQVLNLNHLTTVTPETRKKRIGYCVSGQKIQGLLENLLAEEFPLHKNVMIMIGTNDVAYGSNIDSMMDSYNCLLKYLKSKVEKIVLITVPPIPKLQENYNYWTKLDKFNQYIKLQDYDEKVHVVDFASLLERTDYKTCDVYFEQHFGNSNRTYTIFISEILIDLC